VSRPPYAVAAVIRASPRRSEPACRPSAELRLAERIGLIAGNGRFRSSSPAAARDAGVEVVRSAHRGETPRRSVPSSTSSPGCVSASSEDHPRLQAGGRAARRDGGRYPQAASSCRPASRFSRRDVSREDAQLKDDVLLRGIAPSSNMMASRRRVHALLRSPRAARRHPHARDAAREGMGGRALRLPGREGHRPWMAARRATASKCHNSCPGRKGTCFPWARSCSRVRAPARAAA